MSVYKVDICGVTTSKLPVLKDDEKEELFEKIKKGDKAAREKYIRGNLRLVLSVIRRFSNHNENMDDLFQIGCIGLMKSIDNFDVIYNIYKNSDTFPKLLKTEDFSLKVKELFENVSNGQDTMTEVSKFSESMKHRISP